MEDYYEYLDSNGVTTLYKLIKDDTVAIIDSYSVTLNGITTNLDNHVNNTDIHTPIADIEGMISTAIGSLNYATPDYVDTKISGLVNSAPETLDTLKELSDALGNDPNFATTIATQIGSKANSVHNHVVSDITDFPTIPTKLSQLENDMGFSTGGGNTDITISWTNITDKPTIPTKTSELTNDSGYITNVDWNDVTSKPELSQVAISGSYNDLNNTPTIPTKTSQLINDSGFLTSSSGVITSVSWSDITNKPNFSTVATSGSYNDLSNKPTIPKVYNKTLTIQKNGTNVATFTSNSNTDVTADITVPTKVSELSNDSGFITGISWDKVTNKPTLATVATSGSYTDLSNTPAIPTKLSQLENDMGFGTGGGSGDTSDCVHKTGNETIAGTKTFSGITVSNKQLQYKDTQYDWSDISINTWCDAGHVSWYDKTGNRRIHELVGANGGVWRKACYINENQYFSVDSNKNISYWGTSFKFNGKNVALDENLVHRTGREVISGDKVFQNTIYRESDITTSTVEEVYRFSDTNATPCGAIYNRMHWYNNNIYNRHQSYNATSGKDMYIEVLSANDGSGVVNTGGSVTNNKNLTTVTNATGNSYVATMGWVNNPSTSTNVVHRSGDETIAGNKTFSNKIKGNLQGNADTATSATKASYLDNYSLPGVNKIYLDWDKQLDNYVGLKVDNITMGGLITTKNIGSQAANSATYATTQATSDNSTKIATTAWVRTYVNSVAGSNTVGSSVSAYWSNSSNVTATGQSSSGGNYPACYSEYITKTPVVGTIYSGAQLYTVLNAYASAKGTVQSSGQYNTYITTVTAQATFSNPISPTGKYLCTTANTVRFRGYAPGGNSVGTASVIENSSTQSIFIRVQ